MQTHHILKHNLLFDHVSSYATLTSATIPHTIAIKLFKKGHWNTTLTGILSMQRKYTERTESAFKRVEAIRVHHLIYRPDIPVFWV